MYNGRKFNREQLILVVSTVLDSGKSLVESSLPPDGFTAAEWQEKNTAAEGKTSEWENTIQYISGLVGWNLSILYARITDDGMGMGDVVEFIKYDDLLRDFSREVAKYKIKQAKLPAEKQSGRSYPKVWDNCIELAAEKFVNLFFDVGPNGEDPHLNDEDTGLLAEVADRLIAQIESKTITTYKQLDERLTVILNALGMALRNGKIIHKLVMNNEASTMLTGEAE